MTDDTQYVSNRSEIVLLTDARLANPNGDPRSHDDKPRRDSENYGVITDARLKRYIRDQLSEDEYGVLLENPKFIETGAATREKLYERLLNMTNEELEEADPEDLGDRFLENATDVRYFGATVSLAGEEDSGLQTEAIRDKLASQYIGPVQFAHGESLHPVYLNTESSKLAVTVTSGEEKEQGTFATDNRIRYGIYRFTGVVNENAAPGTHLTTEDIERLDTLIWRAWKNQTLTRSKYGQEPRLYARIEYADDAFHLGDLDLGITLADETPDASELSDIDDVTLDASQFVDVLAGHIDRIETIHIIESDYLTYADRESLTASLNATLGVETIHEVDPYQ